MINIEPSSGTAIICPFGESRAAFHRLFRVELKRDGLLKIILPIPELPNVFKQAMFAASMGAAGMVK